MSQKVFIQIFIKSEEDLPKEDDLYFVHSKNSGKQTKFSFHENKHVWMRCIDWYLQEKELPTMKIVTDKCNKDMEMYADPEELQSKLMNRKDIQEAAYANGFLNCFNWLMSKLK